LNIKGMLRSILGEDFKKAYLNSELFPDIFLHLKMDNDSLHIELFY